MTVVAVELDDKIAVDLKEVAASLQTSENELVRRAVRNYLRQLQMEHIQREAQPYLEAAGFRSEEDVYREVS